MNNTLVNICQHPRKGRQSIHVFAFCFNYIFMSNIGPNISYGKWNFLLIWLSFTGSLVNISLLCLLLHRKHCTNSHAFETIGNYWCQLRARDDQIKRLIDLPEGTSSMFSFFSVIVNPITWALVSEDLQRSVNIFGSEPFVSFVWAQKETQFEWKVFFSHWKYFDCQPTDHHLIYHSDKVVDASLHVNFSWMMSK